MLHVHILALTMRQAAATPLLSECPHKRLDPQQVGQLHTEAASDFGSGKQLALMEASLPPTSMGSFYRRWARSWRLQCQAAHPDAVPLKA